MMNRYFQANKTPHGTLYNAIIKLTLSEINFLKQGASVENSACPRSDDGARISLYI
jgi:hypothetical protein